MFATTTVTIGIPLEFVAGFTATSDGVMPRMVLTDEQITAAVARALVTQLDDGSHFLADKFRAAKDMDESIDIIAELRADVEELIYTASALFLAFTNKTVILSQKDAQ